MHLLWLDAATQDVLDIAEYILERNPSAARATVALIRAQVAALVEHPNRGRPSRSVGNRELVIVGTPYVVAYRLDRDADTIALLRVLHGARQWPPTL